MSYPSKAKFSAVERRERRREQNRIAQKKYRDKMRSKLNESATTREVAEIVSYNTNLDSPMFIQEGLDRLFLSYDSTGSPVDIDGDTDLVEYPTLCQQHVTNAGNSVDKDCLDMDSISNGNMTMRARDIRNYLPVVEVPRNYIVLPSITTLTALLTNAQVFGLRPENLQNKSLPSPFETNPIIAQALPPEVRDLRPVELQYVYNHHPSVDVIPFPTMRTNIIKKMQQSPHGKKYLEEVGFWTDALSGGMLCWGKTPWSARSWELSPQFIVKWKELVDEEIVQQSAFWRAQRL
ncbi:hypothetical protein V1511DRAFT_135273 [Dipodascopsis uninucleata]